MFEENRDAPLIRAAGIQQQTRIGRLRRFMLPIILIGSVISLQAKLQAQSFTDLKAPKAPLLLDAVGSFYVGGRAVSMTAAEIGLYTPGPVVIDQMYVQYMIPHGHSKAPVVLIHGGVLSGKSYETTPDGRMGWYEYFVRKGHPSYVIDQIERARSGFNPAPFNRVRAGAAPPSTQPNVRRLATDRALVRFRIGTEDGQIFPDTQFPFEAAAELAKQTSPDLYEALPQDNPNYPALAELAGDIKGAVLMGHSQAGQYPFETALLEPDHIRAIVSIEPAGCKAASYTDEQIAKLAKVPILLVFGDHLDAPQRVGLVQWTDAFADCQSFVRRVDAAGGQATMFHLPKLGILGNSHMMMQDRNNLQIADLIMSWMDQKVR